MKPIKFLLPALALLLIGGAVASASGTVSGGFGPDEPKVPVPTTPLKPIPGVPSLFAYRYRGMFIALVPSDPEPFAGDRGFIWYVFQSLKFDVAPVAKSSVSATDASALTDAMQWVDVFKGG